MSNFPQRFLVIGASRSGYTLLIQILNRLVERYNIRCDDACRRMRELDTAWGQGVAGAIRRIAKKHFLENLLLYNDMFLPLSGGVRLWDPDHGLVVRKYIGILGAGDMSLLVKMPPGFLDHEPIVSVTGNLDSNPLRLQMAGRRVLSSLRHPFGCVASSVFSVNAIASEYAQRFMDPEADTPALRRELALHKLTDLGFFRALARYYATFYRAYADFRAGTLEVRWERMIRDPCGAIGAIASAAGLPVDEKEAGRIWAELRYRNLNGPHRHNYRPGGGRVPDEWRRILCMEHLTVLREEGLEQIAMDLGYDELRLSDKCSRIQQDVSQMLHLGVVYDRFSDRDYFELSYQKSNVDNSLLKSFKCYPWRNGVRIERSSFASEALGMEIAEAVEAYMASIVPQWGDGGAGTSRLKIREEK